MGNEGIVHTYGAGLSAPAAYGTSIGEFRQAGDGLPVQIDFVSRKFREGPASPSDVLVDNPAEDLRSVGGAVYLLLSA